MVRQWWGMVDMLTGPHHLSSVETSTARSRVSLRRWAPVAILLAPVLAFGLWALRLPNKQAEHTVSIIGNYVASPNSRTVSLAVAAGCTATRVVTAHVDESPSTIRVTVRAKNDYTPPGEAANLCLPFVELHLRSPLGSRAIIDGSTVKVVSERVVAQWVDPGRQ